MTLACECCRCTCDVIIIIVIVVVVIIKMFRCIIIGGNVHECSLSAIVVVVYARHSIAITVETIHLLQYGGGHTYSKMAAECQMTLCGRNVCDGAKAASGTLLAPKETSVGEKNMGSAGSVTGTFSFLTLSRRRTPTGSTRSAKLTIWEIFTKK